MFTMNPFIDLIVSRFNYELCPAVSVRQSSTEALWVADWWLMATHTAKKKKGADKGKAGLNNQKADKLVIKE